MTKDEEKTAEALLASIVAAAPWDGPDVEEQAEVSDD